ncbi:MAG: 4-hydroxy-3-methylbut-2-enyl diphosphate reductase, partial [Acidimicrobiales bacterium]
MIPRLARRSRPETSAAPGRLLALAPLRLEARAVTRGGTTLVVERTGAGPRRAAATALRLLSGGLPSGVSAAAVTGVCGALVDGLEPGDVVVADRVLATDGALVAELPSAHLLAAALNRAGLRTRVGAVISTDHVVRGGGPRAQLEALGAVAVDMESAALAGASWPVPLAVVRVVVDSPTAEVLSLATIRGGRAALCALNLAAPVLEAWAAAAGARTLLLAQPRSFCAGVERAIETVEAALERFGTPVYVRRQIVHNRHVVADLERAGA